MLSMAEVHVVIKSPRNRSDRQERSDHCPERGCELVLALGRLNSCRAGTHG